MTLYPRDGPRVYDAAKPELHEFRADGWVCIYDPRNRDEAWIEGAYVEVTQ